MSIMEKVQALNLPEGDDASLMFLFRSGENVFGGYVEKMFKFHQEEQDEDGNVQHCEVIDSHCGTKNNHLFSVTHDLKVSFRLAHNFCVFCNNV